MYRIAILLLFFLFSNTLRANKLDSLRNLINTTTNDSIKAGAYLSVANSILFNDQKEASSYFDQAYKIGKSKNYKFIFINAIIGKGLIYDLQGKYDKAIENFNEALAFSKQYKLPVAEARSYNSIGISYYNMGDYVKALSAYTSCLKIAEKLTEKDIMLRCLGNIGHVYYSNQDARHSLEYYKKAMALAREVNNPQSISGELQNIGNVFFATEELDSAIYYYEKSSEIDKTLNNIYHLGYNYNNLGNCYSQKGNLVQAEKFYLLSLDIRKKLGDVSGEIVLYVNLTNININKNKLDEALKYSTAALELSKEIKSMEGMQNAYKNMSEIYSKKGDFEKEIFYYKKFISVKDSLFNVEKTRILSEVETKYETEKKENQIIKLQSEASIKEAEISKQKVIKYFLLGIVLLALIAIAVSVYAYKIKRDTNLGLVQKNNEITKQKIEIERQKHEIVSSIEYASRIQAAILPTEHELKTLFPESFVLYKPRDIVSGDFYWTAQKENVKIIAVADCTGHGVPGALMSMLGNSYLNEIVNEKGIESPGEILGELSNKVIASLKQQGLDEDSKDGMDVALIAYYPRQKKLIYSGANNPLWIITNDELIELKADRMPVGYRVNTEQKFTNKEYIADGSLAIYMFTDGYADQFGGAGNKKYSYKRLKEKLKEIYMEPTREQKNILQAEFETWKGSGEQIDDICLIGIKI